jgi:hypothetical protein
MAFGDGPYFEWWNKEEKGTYAGLEKTLAYLRRIDRAHGPFDGVLGFSQGAGLAAICCALKETEDANTDVPQDLQQLTKAYKGLAPLQHLKCVAEQSDCDAERSAPSAPPLCMSQVLNPDSSDGFSGLVSSSPDLFRKMVVSSRYLQSP